ncbi:MAG TPA: tetratricopeptide repeat protein, partial [Caulobacteraceae bacterium]
MAEIGRLADVDVPKAIAEAIKARSEGVRDPLVHHLVGIGLKDQGRFDDAIAELGLGLELDPHDAGIMTTVGFCLLELGRRGEAARVLGVAVKLDPRSPDANYGYGAAAELLGSLEAAESGFKRALALNPDHADALTGLAGLVVRRREFDAARANAERALAINPRQTDAMLHLARVEIGQSEYTAAEARLARILALPDLRPSARASTLIMLGDALDGAKRYPEAFAAYASGQGLLREQYRDAFVRPDVKPAAEAVRHVLTEFEGTSSEGWSRPSTPPARPEERRHAFLLGFMRTGTTLFEQVLASHPDVVALGERPVMIEAEEEFLTQP